MKLLPNLRPAAAKCLTALMVVVAMAATVFAWQAARSLIETRGSLGAVQARALQPAGVASTPAAPADFTAKWPLERIDDDVLDDALRDAQRVGVRVLSAAAAVHPDSKEIVPQSQFTFEVRGPYGNIKGWLNEVMARRDGLAIDALELRRAEAPAAGTGSQEVLASVRLHLFMRPREQR